MKCEAFRRGSHCTDTARHAHASELVEGRDLRYKSNCENWDIPFWAGPAKLREKSTTMAMRMNFLRDKRK
jgi:hypothetical protein